MTFLELCQRLRMEAGIAGSGPSTTANQIGEAGRLVEWIKSAYQDIQDKNPNWDFLRTQFVTSTLPGQGDYLKASIAPGIANWKLDSLRCSTTSVADEQHLYYRDWESFRNTRLFGNVALQSGRPHEFSIKPSKDIVFWPIPDAFYTITGEYFLSPYEFTLDTDTPVFERFHLAIVYNALMRYAAYAAEPSLYAESQRQYGRLINKMELEYCPSPTLGGAMA